MSTESCKICEEESTPWFYIHGHICEMCYMKAKQDCYCEGNTWISVKDGLPEPNKKVLIYFSNNIEVGFLVPDDDVTYELENNEYVFDTDRGAVLDCTHWMPLPSPPENEDAPI